MIQELVDKPEDTSLSYVLKGRAVERKMRWRVELDHPFWRYSPRGEVAICRLEIVAVDVWKKALVSYLPILSAQERYLDTTYPPMPDPVDLLPNFDMPNSNPFQRLMRQDPQGLDWFETVTDSLQPHCAAAWDYVDQGSRALGFHSTRRAVKRHLVRKAMEHFEGYVSW